MIEPMVLSLSWTDYFAIVVIVTAVVVVFDFFKQGPREEQLRGELDCQLAPIERKLNALLKHQGIEPSGPKDTGTVSPELIKLATTPGKMAEAMDYYRTLCPGAGPAEAKAVIEVLAKLNSQPPPPEMAPQPSVPEHAGSPSASKASSTINPELLRLATTPGKTAEAIAFYQVLCPGAGVAEAKAVIEVLAKPDAPPPPKAKSEGSSA